MAKITGLDIPEGLEDLFYKALQTAWLGVSSRLIKRTDNLAAARKKTNPSIFLDYSPFWQGLSAGEKAVWIDKITKTTAEGFAICCQDNFNRLKYSLENTENPDEIVKPTLRCHVIEKVANTFTLMVYARDGKYILSNPYRPNKPQSLVLLDIKDCRKLSTKLKIRTKNFSKTTGYKYRINAQRCYTYAGNWTCEWEYYDVVPDENGNFETLHVFFNAAIPSGQQTFLYVFYPSINYMEGDFFIEDIDMVAYDDDGNFQHLLNTSDLNDYGKTYTGHLLGAYIEVTFSFHNWGDFIDVNFWPKI
jgi:hypothetical protein